MPKNSCKIRTIAATRMAVLILAFTTLTSRVKISQETIIAAIKMIKSTGIANQKYLLLKRKILEGIAPNRDQTVWRSATDCCKSLILSSAS